MLAICWRCWYVIKIVWNVENISNNGELFDYNIDTPKHGKEQRRERECLKDGISKGKVYLIGGKKEWMHEIVDKTSDESFNKAYAEYK